MVHLLLVLIYLAFISLGLPDALLGAAWPVMFQEFHVPVSYAGYISMIITAGTIISSLQSDRLTRRLGVGMVTACSVGLSALSVFGFAMSTHYWQLCVLALPYGLAAGCIDAALNNYVALHFSASHMSWLHCMWGVGASAGPYVMGYALSGGQGWSSGYWYIAVCQVVLTAILLFSLPLWKQHETENSEARDAGRVLSLREILSIRGAKEIMLSFFCYCTIEQTMILWASSYLAFDRGCTSEMAAEWASLFFLGITFGRGVSGFAAMKLDDTKMIRIGQAVIAVGALFLLFPFGQKAALVSLILIGLGCAPVYPCIIHSTPSRFGKEKSQAIVGVQMASAYVGSCVMPLVFGMLVDLFSVSLLPVFLLAALGVMLAVHEKLVRM